MNKNNYLSLGLTDVVLDELCDAQKAILRQHPDSGFEPVARDALHMTVCFFGEALQHLKEWERVEFSKDVQDTIHKAGYIRLTNPRIVKFPPGKENLYVVRYDTNTAGQALVKNLKRRLARFCVHDKKDIWIPHVTLGKARRLGEVDYIFHSMLEPTEIKLCGKLRCNESSSRMWNWT